MNDLKQKYPGLKTLLSVGGRYFGTATMSKMLSTYRNMRTFTGTITHYLRKRGFDGFDLDFEYPGRRGSPRSDKRRYTKLVMVSVAFTMNVFLSYTPTRQGNI